MIRIPRKSLFLGGWDGAHPSEAVPGVFGHYVTDASGHVCLTTPEFLKFDGEDALVRERQSLSFEKMPAKGGTCSLIDIRRHRIPLIKEGALILLPGSKVLPVAVLAALKIPYQDIQLLKPRSIARIAYVSQGEAHGIIRRLTAYFYFLGWNRRCRFGERPPVTNAFLRARCGPWPQVMLTLGYAFRRGAAGKTAAYTQGHFLELASQRVPTTGLPLKSLKAEAECLALAELADLRNRASVKRIVRDVMRYHRSGALYAPARIVRREAALLSLRTFFERSS